MRHHTIRALTAVTLLIAACDPAGEADQADEAINPLSLDPRCHGIAATHAWKIDFSITVNDTGTAADSFRLAFHHKLVGSVTTSPLSTYAPDLVNELQWVPGGASGSFQVHDTLVPLFGGATVTYEGMGFADAGPGDWSRSGGYVIVDLDDCQVYFGLRAVGRVVHAATGVLPRVDTTMVGEFGFIPLAIDADRATHGWTLPTGKYGALAGYNWMPGGGQYVLYGEGYHYTSGASLDSATVSITVTPVAD